MQTSAVLRRGTLLPTAAICYCVTFHDCSSLSPSSLIHVLANSVRIKEHPHRVSCYQPQKTPSVCACPTPATLLHIRRCFQLKAACLVHHCANKDRQMLLCRASPAFPVIQEWCAWSQLGLSSLVLHFARDCGHMRLQTPASLFRVGQGPAAMPPATLIPMHCDSL